MVVQSHTFVILFLYMYVWVCVCVYTHTHTLVFECVFTAKAGGFVQCSASQRLLLVAGSVVALAGSVYLRRGIPSQPLIGTYSMWTWAGSHATTKRGFAYSLNHCRSENSLTGAPVRAPEDVNAQRHMKSKWLDKNKTDLLLNWLLNIYRNKL